MTFFSKAQLSQAKRKVDLGFTYCTVLYRAHMSGKRVGMLDVRGRHSSLAGTAANNVSQNGGEWLPLERCIPYQSISTVQQQHTKLATSRLFTAC